MSKITPTPRKPLVRGSRIPLPGSFRSPLASRQTSVVGSKIRPPMTCKTSKISFKKTVSGEKLTPINNAILMNRNSNESNNTPKRRNIFCKSEKVTTQANGTDLKSVPANSRFATSIQTMLPKVLKRSDTFTRSTENCPIDDAMNTLKEHNTFVRKPVESGKCLPCVNNEIKILNKLNDNKMLPVNETYTRASNTFSNEAATTENVNITPTSGASLPFNSTMNSDYLLDISQQVISKKHMRSLNLTKEFLSPSKNLANDTKLLYMTRTSLSASNTPISHSNQLFNWDDGQLDDTLVAKESCLMSIDTPKIQQRHTAAMNKGERPDVCRNLAVSLQDISYQLPKNEGNFPSGFDLTENTLNCSIELADISLSSTVLSQPIMNNLTRPNSAQHFQLIKEPSFETEESFGILTPEQMKTSNSQYSFALQHNKAVPNQCNKEDLQRMRIEQTPSPEELPLDTTDIKMFSTQSNASEGENTITVLSPGQSSPNIPSLISPVENFSAGNHKSASRSDDTIIPEKIMLESINKSSCSKISTSFITSVTSVTSVTSLDNGYQGDGEMSRPASRGAYDISPSNGPGRRGVSRQPSFHQHSINHPLTVIRSRPDPMTDSDFFTESDADDVLQRGDRRVQVIDGQLYGPMRQSSTSVYIAEDTQVQDSCMDSSGIFTDIENRENYDNVPSSTLLLSKYDGQLSDVVLQTIGTGKDCEVNHESTGDLSSITNGNAEGRTSVSHCSLLSNHDANFPRANYKSSLSLDEAFAGEVITEQNKLNEAKQSIAHYFSECDHRKLSKSSIKSWPDTFDQRQHDSVQKENLKCKHVSLVCLCSTENGMRDNATLTIAPYRQVCQEPQVLAKCAPGNQVDISTEYHSNIRDKARSEVITPELRKAPRAGIHINDSPSTTVQTPATKSGKVNKGKSNVINRESTSSSTIAGRKSSQTPNKWEAVMNQIASNRKVLKTNFSDVKSKVSTGLNSHSNVNKISVRESSKDSRANSTTPPNKCKVSPNNSKIHVHSTGPSVLSKGLTNNNLQSYRSRLYSKDSQKSSLSDLNGRSYRSSPIQPSTPKNLELRSAKKRDVRNLSISPTDLGPPPKTQQTLNGSSTRPKPPAQSINQKRSSTTCNGGSIGPVALIPPTVDSTPAGSVTGSTKGSPNTKHCSLATHSLDIKAMSPLDKLVASRESAQHKFPTLTPNDSTVSIESTTAETSPKLSGERKTGSGKEISVTGSLFLNRSGNSPPNNNSRNRSYSPSPSPRKAALSTNQVTNRRSATVVAVSYSTSTSIRGNEKKSTSISNNVSTSSSRSSIMGISRTYRSRESGNTTQKRSPPPPPPPPTSSVNLPLETVTNQITVEELPKRRASCSNLCCKEQLNHQNKCSEALIVLLNYLINDLDAFSTPRVKALQKKTAERLKQTLLQLDEVKSTCGELQEKLEKKDVYYTQRINEQQLLHHHELNNARERLGEIEILLEVKQKEQSELASLCSRQENELLETKALLKSAEQRATEAEIRVQDMIQIEDNLNKKINAIENSYAESLHKAAEKEAKLKQCIQNMTEELKNLKDRNEQAYNGKQNLSQDELSVLRSARRSLNESSSSLSAGTASARYQDISRLQSDVDSLRSVLDIKLHEISKLSKQNEELMRDAQQRSLLQNRISLLESSNEMLQSELKIKSEREREYSRQIDDIQKAYNHESVKRTRLSYDNEALLWQLKQRSVQLHLVEEKLAELSANETGNSSFLLNSSRSFTNCTSSASQSHLDDMSPPTSPIVKGIIEKADSVSWVLELEDETPEAAASKMCKRVGSFKSNEKGSLNRRYLSVSTNYNSNNSHTQQHQNSQHHDSHNIKTGSIGKLNQGPHPLSQSMSANSVIQEHSKCPRNGEEALQERSNARYRSKSMSVKHQESKQVKCNKKIMRQKSAGHERDCHASRLLIPSVYEAPLHSSSPFVMRQRSSTLKKPFSPISHHQSESADENTCANVVVAELDDADVHDNGRFEQLNASKLITCDTSSLNSGQRLELSSLPSVQDLKSINKRNQQVQESGGEAMVSGANSEDESCSGFSDDAISSTSSNSAMSGSNASPDQRKRNQCISIDDVMLIERINGVATTPMDVSWSEDHVATLESTNVL